MGAPRPVIVAAAASALTLILLGCGDTCQADVEAQLPGAGTNQCNDGSDLETAECQCGNEKDKLQIFDTMDSCTGNTEWFPTNRQTQLLIKETKCCNYATIFGQIEHQRVEDAYDLVKPPSEMTFCQMFQAGIANVTAYSSDCGDAGRKAIAVRPLQQRFDASCTRMQAEKEALV